MLKNNKIFIPVIIAAVIIGVTGFLYLDMVNEDTVNTTQKELVETKSYRVGLLPPPESIFETISNTDSVSDALDSERQQYSHLLNIFNGYDEMLVFVYAYPLSPSIQQTTILFSKNPVTDSTTFQGFIYHEEGIRIDLEPKGNYTQDDLLSHLNSDENLFSISSEVTGQLAPPMREQIISDETFDIPADFSFVDSQNIVEIRGFLTNDEILTLATALLHFF